MLNKVVFWRIFNKLNNIVRYGHIKSKMDSPVMSKIPTINFLTKLLDCHTFKSVKIIEENEKLLDVNRRDLIKSVELLKSLKFSVSEIQMKPMILYVNSMTLENRYNVLRECGCTKITLPILFKYVTITNKKISFLKLHKIIPENVDVQNALEQSFSSDIEIKLKEKLNDEMLLKTIREKVLNEYLIKKLNFTDSQLEKQWKTYGRIRHKSYQSIMQMINLLVNELNFSSDRIIKNGYLLYGDPENLKQLMNGISKIGSHDFKEILYRRPKIIMSSYESVHKTIEYIKEFGISDEAILKCLEILTLGSETVLERLKDTQNIPELKALICNPRILRLVHYQNKVLQRLEYLNRMKVKCASLHILSCDSESFIKFAREGTDRNTGKDIIIYLSKTFNQPESEIRKQLLKHPNWSHIPVSQLKDCVEFLQNKFFSMSDILCNIHILLYPINKIEEKLKILQKDEFYKDLQIETTYTYIPYEKVLTLCLYLIESDFHFTGDGVWTDQHTHNVENFNNVIPDFLENSKKSYKYGVKPSSDNTITPNIVI